MFNEPAQLFGRLTASARNAERRVYLDNARLARRHVALLILQFCYLTVLKQFAKLCFASSTSARALPVRESG